MPQRIALRFSPFARRQLKQPGVILRGGSRLAAVVEIDLEEAHFQVCRHRSLLVAITRRTSGRFLLSPGAEAPGNDD
jgi:hypothetical protein